MPDLASIFLDIFFRVFFPQVTEEATAKYSSY